MYATAWALPAQLSPSIQDPARPSQTDPDPSLPPWDRLDRAASLAAETHLLQRVARHLGSCHLGTMAVQILFDPGRPADLAASRPLWLFFWRRFQTPVFLWILWFPILPGLCLDHPSAGFFLLLLLDRKCAVVSRFASPRGPPSLSGVHLSHYNVPLCDLLPYPQHLSPLPAAHGS